MSKQKFKPLTILVDGKITELEVEEEYFNYEYFDEPKSVEVLSEISETLGRKNGENIIS